MLKNFITLVETQFFINIKTLRSDNGHEFFNTLYSNLLQSKGIIHQSSCVHTLQQNGVVERKHIHLLEVARALRLQASIPLKFWGDCVLTATYIINRLPTPTLNGSSPFEIFHGKPPSLNHFKTLGCLCYATMPNFSDKLSSKAIPSIFMGYSNTQKGYRLYDIVADKFFISRDVKFHENIFPFTHPKSKFMPTSSHLPSIVTSPTDSLSSSSSHVDLTLADPLPRRSTRTTRPSIWLIDYVYPSLPSTNSTSHAPILPLLLPSFSPPLRRPYIYLLNS